MGFISTILIISGLISVDGKPVPDQDVLLVNPRKSELITVVKSDSSGHFLMNYDAPSIADTLKLIAAYRLEEISTVEVVNIPPEGVSEALNINLNSGALIPLEFSVIARRMKPIEYDFSLDLDSVAGVPMNLVEFFLFTSPRSAYLNYQQRFLRKLQFKVLVKPGAISMEGNRIYVDSYKTTKLEFTTARIVSLPERIPLVFKTLEDNWHYGFKLIVTDPCKLEMKMKPYRQ